MRAVNNALQALAMLSFAIGFALIGWTGSPCQCDLEFVQTSLDLSRRRIARWRACCSWFAVNGFVPGI